MDQALRNSDTSGQQSKSALNPLLMLVVMFAAPFIIAAILISLRDPSSFATTQNGTLIEPPFTIKLHTIFDMEGATLTEEKLLGKWRIIYLTDSECNAECLQKKGILVNLHKALGKDQSRVVMITSPSTTVTTLQDIGYQALYLEKECVLLMDQHGHVMMHYSPTANASGILKDIRKLLKYSHA